MFTRRPTGEKDRHVVRVLGEKKLKFLISLLEHLGKFQIRNQSFDKPMSVQYNMLIICKRFVFKSTTRMTRKQ